LLKTGSNRPASTPIMAMTTSSSIKVNARRDLTWRSDRGRHDSFHVIAGFWRENF
jgi:hypothetical protein